MADPTEAELQTQLKNVVALYVATKGWGGEDSPNFLGLVDTIEQAVEGDYNAEKLSAVRAMRATFGNLVQTFRPLSDAIWLDIGKVKNYPDRDAQSIIRRYYRDLHDATESVNSREFTFGSVSPNASNVGGGTVHRLTVDENGYSIENPVPDTKTIECIRDEHTGSDEHEEVFEIRGQHADRDGIVVTGSGRSTTARALSARTSQSLLQNPSFDILDGSAITSLDSLPGWTVGTIGNFELDATNYYRDHAGAGTARALKFTTNDSVEQNLNVVGQDVDPAVPLFLQVAWNRSVGSGDGTITLTFGSQTESVVLAAQSGWQILKLTIGTKNWFKTWNQEDPLVKIALTGNSTGSVLVDDIVLAPFTFFDGLWYAIVGDSTPFLRRDKFLFIDSIASDAKIQRYIAEVHGMYLPSATGAGETISDPA